jgi:hypothetical protein
VWVTLTTEGEIVLAKYYAKYLSESLPLEKLVLLRDGHKGEARYIFQLWELAQIFGDRLYNGCKQLFVDNVLEVEHDELVS